MMATATFANAAIKMAVNVITITLALYTKRLFSMDTPNVWASRPTRSTEHRANRSMAFALLSSRRVISSKANGTYSAKFAWTRIP